MININKYHDLIWLDIVSPTAEEIREVMNTYSLDVEVAEGLLAPSFKSKGGFYNNYIYLVLNFPVLRDSRDYFNQEVDFIIGRGFLITARYENIDPLYKFSKAFEVDSILDKSDLGEHAGFIFFQIIKRFYRSLDHDLDYLRSKISLVESEMFSGKEKEMVFELSNISRDVLRFKESIEYHKNVLESFGIASKRLFGEDFSYYFKSIMNSYNEVSHAVEMDYEIVKELRHTNNSMLSTKENQTMKMLTIVSFATLPSSLIAVVFGMNVRNLPIIQDNNAFYIILGLMAFVTGVIFVFFRHKKWL